MVIDQILLGLLVLVSLAVLVLLFRVMSSGNFKTGENIRPPTPDTHEPENSPPAEPETEDE